MPINRRQLLRLLAGAGTVAAVGDVAAAPTARAASVLSGAAYPAKFTQPLPQLARIDLTGAGAGGTSSATLSASSFSQQILTGYPATRCYGYNGVTPGPTIVASSNRTATVTWKNKLPTSGGTLTSGTGHLLPVDPSMIEASMAALPAGQKPIVTHLHGGHTEWQSDGHPEAWFTQNNTRGPRWQKTAYTYNNSQVSSNLWYHDHSMGLSRINAFAGMAGMYLIRDSVENGLVSNSVLPAPAYETELVIQDRSFTDDGQLSLPAVETAAGQVISGISSDFMLVNGVPWPVLGVEPRAYRFRILNAGDGRILLLTLSNNANFLVVGTDQGLLPQAVAVNRLPVGPGERYDVLINFTGLASGTQVTLQNRGLDGVMQGFRNASGTVTNRPSDTPFGFSNPVANASSSGLIMRFTVNKPLSSTPNATAGPGTTLASLSSLTATTTRQVLTYFGTNGMGQQTEYLGSIPGGTALWDDATTETVARGTTEMWEIYNTGPIVHPIHIHLVDFEIVDRAPFTYTTTPQTMSDGGSGARVTIRSTGTRRAPDDFEHGRKDVVLCYPNEVTRVRANFDRAGNYVWHCHILHHEDHGMMRPVVVS